MENNNNNNVCAPQMVPPFVANKVSAFEMNKKDNIFLVFLLLFCIPFVVLTLWGGFNLGFTLSYITFVTVFSIYLGKPSEKFKLFPWLSVAFAFCGAVVFTLSAQPAVRFWLFVLIVVLTSAWFAYLGGYDMSDDYSIISACLTSTIGTTFGSMKRSMKTVFTLRGGKGTMKVIVSVLCAIPAVLLVITLLRSGDAAFDGLLNVMGKSFGGAGTVLIKIIIGITAFPFLVSLGLGLKKNKIEQKKWFVKTGLENVYIISFLSVISAVYVIYLFSQLAYFFSAFGGILPEGITVASYARRGFFEMSFIAALNFVFISLASLFCIKKENGKRNAGITVIIVFIGVFTLVLIATALSKMILYIGSFGMTRLRILTSAFMVFLAVLFVSVILRGFMKKVPVIKTGIIAACVILCALGFADVDRTVAKYNLYAYENGAIESLDVEAIGNLGEGGIPTLYEIYKNHKGELRIKAKEELEKAAYSMYNVETVKGEKVFERKREVGDFNFSSHKAYETLEKYLGIK